MKDSVLELIAIISILSGLILGFFLIFDYTPVDAFFLEKDDNNAYLEGIILKINVRQDNSTILSVYGCKNFDVYSESSIDKEINESIFLRGSFTDGLFITEEYK